MTNLVKMLSFLMYFFAFSVFSQIPKDVLVQEVGSCAVKRGNIGLENDFQPYQPCETPPINTLLIREFADATFGFYAEYSQFATTQSSCTVMGIGRLNGRSIVGSLMMFDQKDAHEICKISMNWSEKKPGAFSSFDFQALSQCNGVCGMNNNVDSIVFGGDVKQAFSPSFDCSKAGLPTEKTICLDWKLSGMDFQVAELWQELSADKDEKQRQISWVRSRNSCGFNANCIRSSYAARLKALCVASGRKMNARNACA